MAFNSQDKQNIDVKKIKFRFTEVKLHIVFPITMCKFRPAGRQTSTCHDAFAYAYTVFKRYSRQPGQIEKTSELLR